MIKSFCLFLASASLHRSMTLAVLAVVFAIGLLVRRRAPRAGRMLLASSVGAGLLLVAFCAEALIAPGSARTAIVVIDKTSQANEGRLVAAPRWGLVDEEHVTTVEEHIATARAYLSEAKRCEESPLGNEIEPLVLDAYLQTLRGTWLLRRHYQLRAPIGRSGIDLDDAARAIALQMAFDVEQEQENAPALTGMGLTAFQFEDLPSALYASIGAREPSTVSGASVFARDGWNLVSREARTYSLPRDASPAERDAFARVRHAHSIWSRPDGTLESPFAADVGELAFAAP